MFTHMECVDGLWQIEAILISSHLVIPDRLEPDTPLNCTKSLTHPSFYVIPPGELEKKASSRYDIPPAPL